MSRWKSAILVVGVLLGGAAVTLLWIDVVAARRWADIQRGTAALEKELDAPRERTPLRVESLPGDAWDDYAAAKSGARNRDAAAAMEAFLKRGTDRDKARDLALALNPAVEKLLEGARRSTAARPAGATIDATLVNAARVRARLAWEERRDLDATRTLTDLVRVGQDDAASAKSNITYALGHLTAQQAADDLLKFLSERGAPPDLAQEASRLETSNPPAGRFLLLERVDTARKCEDSPYGFSLASGGPGWRFGGSGRLHLAATLDRVEGWARVVAERRERPWPEVRVLRDEAKADAERSGNKLLGTLSSSILMENYGWDLRARLRLIQAGARFRASGEKPSLEDPYGGSLTWDDEGVRSRGATEDSKDDIILRLKR